MDNKTNAHSDLGRQVFFTNIADDTAESLYNFLDHDMQEAVRSHDLSLDMLRASIITDLVLDMFNSGVKSHEIHDLIRDTFTAWKRARAKVGRR